MPTSQNAGEPRSLKRVVLKEEFVQLTGNFQDAIVLNQMIYWSERTKDIDKYIAEESKRMANEGMSANMDPLRGWIYKSAEELAEETLMGVSVQTMRRILARLVESGWIDERNNPKYKWDRTKQYRVNLVKIQTDLNEKGYALEGYSFPFSKMENGVSTVENGVSKMENQMCNLENQISSLDEQYQRLHTEITNKEIDDHDHDGQVDFLSHLNPPQGDVTGPTDEEMEGLRHWVERALKYPKVSKRVFFDLARKHGADYLMEQAMFIREHMESIKYSVAGAFVRAVAEDWATRGHIPFDERQKPVKNDSRAAKSDEIRIVEYDGQSYELRADQDERYIPFYVANREISPIELI